MTGPIVVRVDRVARSASPDQPIDVHLMGHRPFRPCKSMRRVLIALWGDDGKMWPGKFMRLYCDPSVRFGGVAVGGIRISHVSGIEKPIDLMLTTTRSKRAPYRVEPLDPAGDYPEADFTKNVDKWVTAIKASNLTVGDVVSRAAKKGLLTPDQCDALTGKVKGASDGI